jgi:hypothetical protein
VNRKRCAVSAEGQAVPDGFLDVGEHGLHHLFLFGPVGHVGEGVVGGVDAEVREYSVRCPFGLDLQGGTLRLRGTHVAVEQMMGQLMRQALNLLVVGERLP